MSSLHNDLAEAIRSGLLPQRFPVRRDVELGAGVGHADGSVSFYDTVWLGQRALVVAAVRIRRPGIEGALDAASFRQLLRAALAVLDSPRAALSASLEISGSADIDAAVMRFDTATGAMTSATSGEARVDVVAKGGGESPLSPGDIVWVAAGAVPAPATCDVPIEGLDRLVRPAIERAGDGCVAALLFRSHAREAKSSTFVVANDPAAIPDLLRQIEAFFARHAVAMDDVEGIDVALDEILTNVIAYGFKDGNAHEIFVVATAEAQGVVFEIRDDGAPFDPLDVPAPDLSADIDARQIGGLGMHFVRTLLDDVAYQRVNGWNVLTLHKHLAGAAQHREGSS